MAASTMGVKLDENTRARLKKLGQQKKRSAHWLMKEAIHRYLEEEERYEQEKAEDMARYHEYVETGKHITQDDMMAWLDELAERAARKTRGE
jgi:predicted transcriptional regulator